MSEHDRGLGPPTGFDPDDPSLFLDAPKWPKVVGIISICWAGLGLFCTGCGLAMIPFWSQMMEPTLEGAPLPPTMVMGPLDWALGAIGLGLTFVLLFAGIATAGRKPVGRTLHLAYGVAALPIVAVNIWNALEKNAAMAQWAADYPNNPMAQGQTGPGAAFGVAISVAMILLFGLAWPVFCLVWFGLVKRTPESMTAGVGTGEVV
ncbi:MAG: hypothetical protein KIS87_13200 [Phycisphaeraceae bacterium]|nr:hypothetical protein [Phycisphaeraceae bacterium]